jgi:2-polyprenyl-6-methoxyphenol hydroxylase-like FAD-dependent oxidoreductase
VNLGQLTLESGEILTGDLIVGADGVNSLLQSYVLRGEDHEEEEKSVAGKVPLFLGYLMEVPYNAIQDAAGKEFLDSSGASKVFLDSLDLNSP